MMQGSVETRSFKKHLQLLCNGKIKNVAMGTFGSQISEAGRVRTNSDLFAIYRCKAKRTEVKKIDWTVQISKIGFETP